jgi:hypothetical protein
MFNGSGILTLLPCMSALMLRVFFVAEVYDRRIERMVTHRQLGARSEKK